MWGLRNVLMRDTEDPLYSKVYFTLSSDTMPGPTIGPHRNTMLSWNDLGNTLKVLEKAYNNSNFPLVRKHLFYLKEKRGPVADPQRMFALLTEGGIDILLHILFDPHKVLFARDDVIENKEEEARPQPLWGQSDATTMAANNNNNNNGNGSTQQSSSTRDRNPHRAPTGITFNSMNEERCLFEILYAVLSILTEIILGCNEVGWYFYDHYPGLFFRLLELMEVPRLYSTAGCLLEHLISCVGPVLEIVKTPQLMKLLRSENDAVVVAAVRVVALLTVYGMDRPSAFPHRRLSHQENAFPTMRVQRILDSNALWLLGEKNFIARLIRLCEVETRSIRVQQGDHILTVMAQDTADTGASLNDIRSTTDVQTLLAQLLAVRDYVNNGTEVVVDVGGIGHGSLEETIRRLTSLQPQAASGERADANEAEEEVASHWSDDTRYLEEDQQGRPALAALGGQPYRRQEAGAEEATTSCGPCRYPHRVERFVVHQFGKGFAEAKREAVSRRLSQQRQMAYTDRVEVHMEEYDDEEDELPPPPPFSNWASEVEAAPMSRTASFSSNNLDGQQRPQREDAQQPTGPNIPDEFIQQIIDEEALSAAAPSFNFKWLFGSVGSRERWRLEDLLLLPNRDDNRPEMLGFGAQWVNPDGTVAPVLKLFQLQNEKFLKKYFNSSDLWGVWGDSPLEVKQMIVESQSEILFLLNVLLSTFYFSDIWNQMRKAEWLKRSVKIFDFVFELDPKYGRVVDVAPPLVIPEEIKRLPPFHPTLEKQEDDLDVNVDPRFRPQFPSDWCLPPFMEMVNLSSKKDNFWMDRRDVLQKDQEEFAEEKSHHHGPNTIRKLELLRTLHEFWNAQDVSECHLLLEKDIIPYAGTLAAKILTVLESGEDSCVESSACNALEALLRTFCFPCGQQRNHVNSPQSLISDNFFTSVLETLVYKGTRMPFMDSSLQPPRRLDGYFSLFGELIRYHYHNMVTLGNYVSGEVSTEGFRDSRPIPNNQRSKMYQPTSVPRNKDDEHTLRNPPMERQEGEPFGSVLLRRLYEYPNDTNLFLRSLILSLTPGLRSSRNYIHKLDDGSVTVVPSCDLSTKGRPTDLIINHHYRMGFMKKVSRDYTTAISELLEAEPLVAREERVRRTGPKLVELLHVLENSIHRLPLEQRAYPDLLHERDVAFVLGKRSLPPHGPPADMAVPLFSESASKEADLLPCLSPLQALLSAPHRLVYASIVPFNLEELTSSARLCVITTTILLCLRVSHQLGGEEAVVALLEAIRPFAMESYAKWEEIVANTPSHYDTYTKRCTCEEPCESFVLYGHCQPAHEAAVYFGRYGGCFYRNLFRLLCQWVSHYWANQRYVGTLFFSTEVPFAEYKNTALILMKHLPSFFIDPREASL